MQGGKDQTWEGGDKANEDYNAGAHNHNGVTIAATVPHITLQICTIYS